MLLLQVQVGLTSFRQLSHITLLDKLIDKEVSHNPYKHRRSLVLAFGGAMASAVARAYNGGLGAVPPAGSRGRAPGQGVWGAKPPRS